MDKDLSLAWSCAANLSLYDEDPGSRVMNVGSRDEPRLADRRQALLDLYARQILVDLEAGYDRVINLRGRCEERAAAARTLRGGLRTAQARRRLPGVSWPSVVGALTRGGRREIAELWAIGAELADRAATMMNDAGADQDAKARARLLASMKHTLTYDVIGAVVPADVERQAAEDLAQTLREIDERDADDS